MKDFELVKQDLMSLVFSAYGDEEKHEVYKKSLRRYTQSCLFFAECTRRWPKLDDAVYYGVDMKEADWKISENDNENVGLSCEWAYKKRAHWIITHAEFYYVRTGISLAMLAVNEEWNESQWQQLRIELTGKYPPESYLLIF